jgi:hypothetical protein
MAHQSPRPQTSGAGKIDFNAYSFTGHDLAGENGGNSLLTEVDGSTWQSVWNAATEDNHVNRRFHAVTQSAPL